MGSRLCRKFLDLTAKHDPKKETLKLDFPQIKNFCFLKDPARRMKRQAAEWEKAFAKHVSNKELVGGWDIEGALKTQQLQSKHFS